MVANGLLAISHYAWPDDMMESRHTMNLAVELPRPSCACNIA